MVTSVFTTLSIIKLQIRAPRPPKRATISGLKLLARVTKTIAPVIAVKVETNNRPPKTAEIRGYSLVRVIRGLTAPIVTKIIGRTILNPNKRKLE